MIENINGTQKDPSKDNPLTKLTARISYSGKPSFSKTNLLANAYGITNPPDAKIPIIIIEGIKR